MTYGSSQNVTHNYDARDPLLSKATPYGTLNYTYDATSNLRSMRSNNTNGITVTYSYDVLNRLGAGANTTTYVYSPTSTLKSVTLPNGVLLQQIKSHPAFVRPRVSVILPSIASFLDQCEQP